MSCFGKGLFVGLQRGGKHLKDRHNHRLRHGRLFMPVQYAFAIAFLGINLAIGFAVSWASEKEQSGVRLDLDAFVSLDTDLEIAFCALDINTNSRSIVNEHLVGRRFAPWSTFKIPNLIIALEAGIATGLNHWRGWDQQRRPAADYWPQVWQQDQTLASAFKRSAVWYFQDIAQEVGPEQYRYHLRRFGYGNASVPVDSDDFWLGGSLAISPCEQTQFLKQAVAGHLNLSAETEDALRTVSRLRAADGYTVYGKTGSGRLAQGEFEGWLVGWIEHERRPTATFALYLRAPDYQTLESSRFETALALLRTAGHWPLD